MTPLESARAKLQDATLGALTPEESLALYQATINPPRTHGPLTQKVITEIITAAQANDPNAAILAVFKTYNLIPTLDKTWDSPDAFKDIRTA